MAYITMTRGGDEYRPLPSEQAAHAAHHPEIDAATLRDELIAYQCWQAESAHPETITIATRMVDLYLAARAAHTAAAEETR